MNCVELFFIMLLISSVTFGGGYQAIPFFKKHFVDSKIIDEKDFLKIIKTEALIPGSVGLNLAVLIGKLVKGNIGLIISSIAWILPSIIVIILLYKLIIYNENKYYKSFLKGILLCTIALIINTLIYIVKTSSNIINLFNIIFLIIVIILLQYDLINNFLLILISGFLFILFDNKKEIFNL